MWRDRSNLYISYRQSYAHHPTKRTKYSPGIGGGGGGNGFSDPYGGSTGYAGEDRQGLLSSGAFEDDSTAANTNNGSGGGGGDAVIEMDVLPPRWADVTDEVTDLLADVARQSQALERLHQKHVLPGFNDEDSKRAEEREIERLTRAVTRGFHDCHACIQRVERMVADSRRQGSLSRGEEAMARNIQVSLASRVQEASAGFRKKQSAYLKKLRGMSGANLAQMERSSAPMAGGYTDPSLIESDADRSFSQSTIQATMHQKLLHSNDTVIMQREKEIEDIAQGIIDLSDLFRDLQTMVIDQGTMLDRIDYNVERMATDVKEAAKELKVASGYQRRTTKRKIILLLILIIVGMIILLVAKPKKANAPRPPDLPPAGGPPRS